MVLRRTYESDHKDVTLNDGEGQTREEEGCAGSEKIEGQL